MLCYVNYSSAEKIMSLTQNIGGNDGIMVTPVDIIVDEGTHGEEMVGAELVVNAHGDGIFVEGASPTVADHAEGIAETTTLDAEGGIGDGGIVEITADDGGNGRMLAKESGNGVGHQGSYGGGSGHLACKMTRGSIDRISTLALLLRIVHDITVLCAVLRSKLIALQMTVDYQEAIAFGHRKPESDGGITRVAGDDLGTGDGIARAYTLMATALHHYLDIGILLRKGTVELAPRRKIPTSFLIAENVGILTGQILQNFLALLIIGGIVEAVGVVTDDTERGVREFALEGIDGVEGTDTTKGEEHAEEGDPAATGGKENGEEEGEEGASEHNGKCQTRQSCKAELCGTDIDAGSTRPKGDDRYP